MILDRLDQLARHTDVPGQLTRGWLTPAHRAAADLIEGWMREAGMTPRRDGAGSVIGRYEGKAPNAKAIVTGSHFDTVRNGGRYDGQLGILVPIEVVSRLNARGERLAHAVEVVAFADEEGARFQTSFLASRAYLGRFDESLRARRDADGVTFDDAMRAAGLDPAGIGGDGIDPSRIAAYVEVHIEQGPVLLDEGLPLGVVTAIAGGTRHRVEVSGEAGHAGTVPMARRRDALAAAAEMVVAVEGRAKDGGTGAVGNDAAIAAASASFGKGDSLAGRSVPSLVGTVGMLEVPGGTGNVIPGLVRFTVDLRSPDDAVREAAERDVFAAFDSIAARRGVTVKVEKTHGVKATACDESLQAGLARAVEGLGIPVRKLPSGAGHDAMILAEAVPAAMLFVRCGAGGVSHNPAETVTAEDAALAVAALEAFLKIGVR